MWAARRLTRLLADSCQDDDQASHYLIAHSHGGNIALWAANSPLRGFIKGVACLSTPFLHIGPRWESGLVGVNSAWLLVVLFIVWLYDRKYNLSLLALVSGIGVPVLIGFLLILLIWFRLEKSIEFAQPNMVFPQEFQDRTLVLRAAGDEASQVLVAAQFGNWMVERISIVVSAVIRSLGRVIPDIHWEDDRSYRRLGKILCSIVLFAGEIAVFEVFRRLWWTKHYIGSGMHRALVLFIAIYAVLFLWVTIESKGYESFLKSFLDLFARACEGIVRIASSVFLLPLGTDAVIFSWFFRMHAEPSPPGWAKVKYVEVDDFSGNWISPRHSLYDNAKAIEEIVRWIKTREQAGPIEPLTEMIQYLKQSGQWPDNMNDTPDKGSS